MSTENKFTAGTAFKALLAKPWIWSFVGAAVVWVAAILFTGGLGGGGMITAALSFSVFFALAGIGQMFVVTLGPGNVDLSIPANMALSAVVGFKLMGGHDSMILVGVVGGLATGGAVGAANYLIIRLLRIPPIIATLSAAFLIQSLAIVYGRGLLIKPPNLLADFTSSMIGGVPVLAIAAVIFSIGMAILLDRTVFGRSVLAIGQNMRAARFAGVAVESTRLRAYVLCGVLTGLCGVLLAAFSGGASLDMGAEYLLSSIAVVVIGGTSVSGGKANVPGIWGASLFLFLLVTMLNTYGFGTGVRLLFTGAIIIAVIAVAGGDKASA